MLLFVAMTLSAVSRADAAAELEAAVRDKAISLCDSGGMIDDDSGVLGDLWRKFTPRSRLCQDLYDGKQPVQEIFSKHDVPYRRVADWSGIQVVERNVNEHFACIKFDMEGNEGLCKQYLSDKRVKSAEDFKAVHDSCEGGVTCIRQYLDFDYPDKGLSGLRKAPQRAQLSLDALLGNQVSERPASKEPPEPAASEPAVASTPTNPPPRSSLSLDGLMAGGASSARTAGLSRSEAKAPSLAFDNIYAGRAAVRSDRQREELERTNARIVEDCGCLASSLGCFRYDRSAFRESAVLDVVTKSADTFNDSMRSVCQDWNGMYQVSSDMSIEEYKAQTDIGAQFLVSFGKIDDSFEKMIASAKQQDNKIQQARREQARRAEEARRKERNAQIFKVAAALGGAALAGANLPTEQAMRFTQAWVNDVMSGTVSNMQQLNEELRVEVAQQRQRMEQLSQRRIARMKRNEVAMNERLLENSYAERVGQQAQPAQINSPSAPEIASAPRTQLPGLTLPSQRQQTQGQPGSFDVASANALKPGDLTGTYWGVKGPQKTDTTFGGQTVTYHFYNTLKFHSDGSGVAYSRSVYSDGDIINENLNPFTWEIDGNAVVLNGSQRLVYSGGKLGEQTRGMKGPMGSYARDF